jgi:hypothetical protein
MHICHLKEFDGSARMSGPYSEKVTFKRRNELKQMNSEEENSGKRVKRAQLKDSQLEQVQGRPCS